MMPDVTMEEFLELTKHYSDADTFRWYTVSPTLAVRVTFGEVRRAMSKVVA